jgi:tetratricopeptide (TPR) repeat protein
MKFLTLELLGQFEAMTELYSAQQYDEALAAVETLLQVKGTSEEFRDSVLYYRAAILDNQGKTRDAISIFAGLAERNPADLTYAQSMDIVIQNLGRRVKEELEADVSFAAVESYVKVFTEIYFVPFWLERKYCLHLAANGEGDRAKRRAEALLNLSPSDVDYLGVAIEVASAAGNHTWVASLRRRVESLLEQRPYDLKLQALIPIAS